MEYYNNILCVSGSELNTILSLDYINKLTQRGIIKRERRACYTKSALYNFDSIPDKYRQELIKRYGDPRENAKIKPFKDTIEQDHKALSFFSTYILPDGRGLPDKNITEYSNDAAILNAIIAIHQRTVMKRNVLGAKINKTSFWRNSALAIQKLNGEYSNTLPKNERRLRDRCNKYIKYGYEALVSAKFCNDNSRKVSDDIKRLLYSMYVMPNKPYTTSVHELYMLFVNNEFTVYDQESGEMFNAEDFKRNGEPIELSESTIWNYINIALEHTSVDKKRTGILEYNTTHRPHHHRHAPVYSFSKISLDDRDLPRRLLDGGRVKAYYSYDVASGCCIGKAYSRNKDRALFIDCMKDMFRFLDYNGYGIPMEVEVEHHLVNTFKDGLMQAGVLFPFIRWCNPGNSQEKRAEHFNRMKKYGAEKDGQAGIGRFYARLEANRPKVDKVDDEYNDKKYPFEQLVADDLASIYTYNNTLHHNQKLYPGMSRLDVLTQNMNPNLAKINKAIWYKYIGEKTSTSIRRNQYCWVQNEKYQLESPEVLERLKPNNYKVEAYWLAGKDGSIKEIYLHQGDTFLCRCEKLNSYNEAICEQTDADREAYTKQAKYVSHFDKIIKERNAKLVKIGIINNKEFNEIDKTADDSLIVVDNYPREDFMKRRPEDDDIENLINEYDPEAVRRMAREQI